MAIRGLALTFIICLLATPAWGQPACNKRQEVFDLLAKKYQESLIASGITSRGELLEVLAKKDGSTWSIVLTTPRGPTCLIAAGDNWRTKLWAPEGEGT